MNVTLRKLLGLNLAILALFLFALPAYAWEADLPDMHADGEEPIAAPEWVVSPDDYSSLRNEALSALNEDADSENDEDGPSEDAAAQLQDGSYVIEVGSESFMSDETRSGDGWSYEGGVLFLNEYNGPGIWASGDLTVYSTGDVTVTGSSGSYGSNAISAAGDVILYAEGCTLNVNGGSGTYCGGNAISACDFLAFIYDGRVNLTGGSSPSGSGGHGLDAYDAYVFDFSDEGAQFNAAGGNASVSSSEAVAGCGVYANMFCSSCDGVLSGGNGYNPAPAVCFYNKCEFGLANIEISGGRSVSGEYEYAVICSRVGNMPTYIHPHTTVTGNEYAMSIEINKYTLELFGRGGSLNYSTYTSLCDYYPARYDLSEYLHKRGGYTQVAWSNASGDLIELDRVFTPVSDTQLYAEWLDVSDGDVVLNALGGMFADGSRFVRYRGASNVGLPAELTYNDTEAALAGWGTVLSPKADENGVLDGNWYAAGSSIAAPEGTYLALYAEYARDGFYIVYHPTAGRPSAGGDVTVQYDYKASCSSLELYAIDQSYLEAPNGRTFVGWSTKAAGAAEYKPGDGITVPLGGVVDLYAVWDGAEYGYVCDGCTAWVDREKKTVTVELDAALFESPVYPASVILSSYDEDGKLTGCAVCNTPQTGAALTLSYAGDDPPRFKLIALDKSLRPTGRCADINIPGMEPSLVR
ncbi:MAG: hypothetical protein IKD89_02010 [Clostridia bacterium]|nr:hypothetical protein [Clostridia bacterium]